VSLLFGTRGLVLMEAMRECRRDGAPSCRGLAHVRTMHELRPNNEKEEDCGW
jgi:hypothetical protein